MGSDLNGSLSVLVRRTIVYPGALEHALGYSSDRKRAPVLGLGWK